MTMLVVYLRDHDGHKAGKEYSVERTLGARVCEAGIAMPYIQWVEKTNAEKKAVEDAKAAKEKEERLAEKLKKEAREKRRTADSKKTETAEKAVTE